MTIPTAPLAVLISLCALILTALARIMIVQNSIRTEAKNGREALHKRIDPISLSVTTLAAQHIINHPGQKV